MLKCLFIITIENGKSNRRLKKLHKRTYPEA